MRQSRPRVLRAHRALLAILALCQRVPAGEPPRASPLIEREPRPTSSAPATQPADPDERLALARARTAVWRAVRGLPLGELSLSDWLAREGRMERGLRQWVYSLRAAAPARTYSDGSHEITIVLRPEELRAQIGALSRNRSAAELEAEARHPDGVAGESPLERAARGWREIVAVGQAFPGESVADRPAGWENVSAHGLQAARNAARADAISDLLVATGELKLTNARRLSDWLQSGGIADELAQQLDKLADIRATLSADQTATAEARIRLAELVRALGEVSKQQGKPAAPDFREMMLINNATELIGRGAAVPPERDVSPVYAPPASRAPDWVGESLTATGMWRSNGGPRLSSEAALAQARQAALENLQKQAENLLLRQDAAAAAEAAQRRELIADLRQYIDSAELVAEPQIGIDGAVEIQMELPLRRLWHILRLAQKTAAADAAATPASAPAEREP